MRGNFLILITILLASCTNDVPRDQSKSCLPQSSDAATLSEVLKEKNLPHYLDSESKCIYYENTIREKVEKIKIQAFGTPPPPGLNISRDSQNKDVEQLLVSNGIKTEKYIYHGTEYIAWSHADHEKAEELLNIEPWKKEILRKMREQK